MLKAIQTTISLFRVLVVCCGVLSGLYPAQSSAQGSLVFSTIADNPYVPMGTEVLSEAYQQLGLKIKVVEYPSVRSLDLANRGLVDGELGRAGLVQADYQNLIKVPVPLLKLDVVAFSKSVQFKVNGWQSLEPYRLGILNGNVMIGQNALLTNKVIVETPEQLFSMLMKDRVQLVVIERLIGILALQEFRDNQVIMLEPPIYQFTIFHYLHKKHEDLVPKISSALEQIITSGRFAELYYLRISKISQAFKPAVSQQ